MQDAEFAILGAGALGSIVGAHLARAGRRVVLLARPGRARQIEEQGVRIIGLASFSHAVPVLAEPRELRSAEFLILATKTHATDAALAPLRAAKIGAALSIQNGVMKNAQLSAVFGAERVLGSLADFSGELLASGDVRFTRNANMYVGEINGLMSARATHIATTIDAAGVRSTAVPNIQTLEWAKFAAWVGMMVVAVVTRARTPKYLMDPGSAAVLVRLVREIGALATARGIPLSDQSVLPVATLCRGTEAEAVAVLQRFGAELDRSAPEHRMSGLQDLEAGRPLEIEETLGYALTLAHESRQSLPLLESFVPLLAAIDRMRRS